MSANSCCWRKHSHGLKWLKIHFWNDWPQLVFVWSTLEWYKHETCSKIKYRRFGGGNAVTSLVMLCVKIIVAHIISYISFTNLPASQTLCNTTRSINGWFIYFHEGNKPGWYLELRHHLPAKLKFSLSLLWLTKISVACELLINISMLTLGAC